MINHIICTLKILTDLCFTKRKTKIKNGFAEVVYSVLVEKISDIDKYLFTERGLRGGISYIAKRHVKANNKYTKNYDLQKPSTFITYLDMNNL